MNLNNISFKFQSPQEEVYRSRLGKIFSGPEDKYLLGIISPQITSANLGDEIIMDAVKQELYEMFPDRFMIEFSSYAGFRHQARALYNRCELRFWGGSNMLHLKLLPAFNASPDIPLHEAMGFRRSILLGIGTGNGADGEFNFLARFFYKRMLSKTFIHSVRDNITLMHLKKIGVNNVINTGCPTVWRLTDEHCSKIPVRKASRVVFTLNAHRASTEFDRELIKTLYHKYDFVYFFPQMSRDLAYLYALDVNTNKINIIPANLESYNNLLNFGDIDYIGLRLHGGIRALQKKCRSLIVTVDNRATNMQSDIGFPIIGRSNSDFDKLNNWICNPTATKLKINLNGIERWKAQNFHV